MEKQPLLSVIVPVYNTSKYLIRCINSLLKQSYGNLEIVLIDDGSTDGSDEICDRLVKDYSHIRVLHKVNGGLGYARNSGLEMARGQYVTFLDSDDYVHEDMYRCLMEQILTENADAAFCDFCHVSSDGRETVSAGGLTEGKHTAKDILLGMLGALPEASRDFDLEMSVCKAVYDMRLIRKENIRFLSERDVLCEDLFFNYTFLMNAKYGVYVSRGFYYYCENVGSLTHRFDAGRLEREKKLFSQVSKLAETELPSEYQLRWHRQFLGRVRSMIVQHVRYAKKMSLSERLRAIRAIAEDEIVSAVLRRYPIGRTSLKLRIFHTFLKWKFCMGMYFLIVLNR